MAEKQKSDSGGKFSRYGFYLLLTLILFLFVIRFARLEIDPPYFFAGYTQSDLTDPYHLTFFSRNAVLFGDWNLFDYHRWDVFKYSIVSGLSFILFSLFGVSRVTANLSGLILNLGGLLLFALGLRRLRSLTEIAITIFLLLLSGLLLFHARLPYLENGLIFLCGLTFLIFIRYHNQKWGQFATGFLIALAALAGKLFGFVLLAPVIGSLIYAYHSRAYRPILLTLAGCVAGIIIYTLVFYGGDFSIMSSYYGEQSLGMYGMPQGLTSPTGFLQRLITFGAQSGFFELSKSLIILGALGTVLLVFTMKSYREYKRENLPLVFCLIWLLGGVMGLMPFNYRPMRYDIFLFLPMAAISAYAINLVFRNELTIDPVNRVIANLVLFFISWYLLLQSYIYILPLSMRFISGAQALIFCGIVSLLLTVIAYSRTRRRKRVLNRTAVGVIAALLLLATVIGQGTLIYQGLALPGKYLKEANREISQMIDQDAVLTGPYAPALTIDNKLKGLIYVFGLANKDKELFDRFPITHIVADRSNWDAARKDYPFLGSSLSLCRIRIRDAGMYIFRLPDKMTPATDYEKATMAYSRGQNDSGLTFIENFVREYPDNIAGRFARLVLYNRNDQAEKLPADLKTLAVSYPDNYQVQMSCKDFYDALYKTTGEEQYKTLAEIYFRQAKSINPTLKQ